MDPGRWPGVFLRQVREDQGASARRLLVPRGVLQVIAVLGLILLGGAFCVGMTFALKAALGPRRFALVFRVLRPLVLVMAVVVTWQHLHR